MTELDHLEVVVSYETKDLWRLYLSRYLSFHMILIFSIGLAIYGIFISVVFLRQYIAFSHIVDSVIFGFLFTLIYLVVAAYYSVKYYRQKRKEQYHFEFTHKSIKIAYEFVSSEIEWRYFSKAVENTNYFQLFTKEDTRYLVPKRCFTDVGQVDTLRYLLRSKSDVLSLSLK